MIQLKGFTLLELLFALCVITTLTLCGIYSSYSLVSKNEKEMIIDSIRAAVQFAKIQALQTGDAVFLSSLNDTNWNKGLRLTQINPETKHEILIHECEWHYVHWIIHWVGVVSQKEITISATPAQSISNGHFNLFNPLTKERGRVVLNRLGRVKIDE